MELPEASYAFDPKCSWFVVLRPPPHHSKYEVFESLCDSLIVYNHDKESKRPHAHMLIQNWKKSVKTLRNRLKDVADEITIQGFKPRPDHGRTITYMTKGHYEPTYNTKYSEAYLRWCKEQWVGHIKKVRTPIEEFWDEWIDSHAPRIDKFDQERFDTDPDYFAPKKPTQGDVYKSALSFMAGKTKGFVTMAVRNMARCLTDTYCFRNKISEAKV